MTIFTTHEGIREIRKILTPVLVVHVGAGIYRVAVFANQFNELQKGLTNLPISV
jgi:hypothetical protein